VRGEVSGFCGARGEVDPPPGLGEVVVSLEADGFSLLAEGGEGTGA